MPPPPSCNLDLLILKVQVTCDVGYLCQFWSSYMPLCSRLMPNVRDRQTDAETDVRQHHRLMPPPIMGAGHNK